MDTNKKLKIKYKLSDVKRSASKEYYLGFRRGIDAYRYNKITQVFMSINVIKNNKEFKVQKGLFAGWLFINELQFFNKNKAKKSHKPKKRYASKKAK